MEHDGHDGRVGRQDGVGDAWSRLPRGHVDLAAAFTAALWGRTERVDDRVAARAVAPSPRAVPNIVVPFGQTLLMEAVRDFIACEDEVRGTDPAREPGVNCGNGLDGFEGLGGVDGLDGAQALDVAVQTVPAIHTGLPGRVRAPPFVLASNEIPDGFHE